MKGVVKKDLPGAPESFFEKIADRVSYGMGTPVNIIVWLLLVAGWVALGPYLAHHEFLPTWFTSNGFNFPLNTVTTIAELYIGFLVAAAANRNERSNRALSERQVKMIAAIKAEEDEIAGEDRTLHQLLVENTKLTTEVHKLAQEIRRMQKPRITSVKRKR